jgi:hypothetical protein
MDDLQIRFNNKEILDITKMEFKTCFKMTDLGKVHHILGLHILQDKKQTSIDQAHYIESVLKKAKMDNCKPMNMPMELKLHLIPLLPDEEGYKIEEY